MLILPPDMDIFKGGVDFRFFSNFLQFFPLKFCSFFPYGCVPVPPLPPNHRCIPDSPFLGLTIPPPLPPPANPLVLKPQVVSFFNFRRRRLPSPLGFGAISRLEGSLNLSDGYQCLTRLPSSPLCFFNRCSCERASENSPSPVFFFLSSLRPPPINLPHFLKLQPVSCFEYAPGFSSIL